MKVTKELQIQILMYLVEHESASSRKIARGLGESRPRVKEAIRNLIERGFIEKWVQGTWIDPDDVVIDMPKTRGTEDTQTRLGDAPRAEMRIEVRRL